MSTPVLISGGAGYLGSHVAYLLKQRNFDPIVLDNLSSGNAWAAPADAFEQGAIDDPDFVQSVCQKYAPVAAVHCASAQPSGVTTENASQFFADDRERTTRFFRTLNAAGVKKIVFASTAAVYGDTSAFYNKIGGNGPVSELYPAVPLSPYGQAALEKEAFLRMMDADDVRSVSLRLFNLIGAAPLEARLGEAHFPEPHLIPRLILNRLNLPPAFLKALDLEHGVVLEGDDYPTPDGTAIRDFVHVLDVAKAHAQALTYLLDGGETTIVNVGSGQGTSANECVAAIDKLFGSTIATPPVTPRRDKSPAILVADARKAATVLDWRPTRSFDESLNDALRWFRSAHYHDALRTTTSLEKSTS